MTTTATTQRLFDRCIEQMAAATMIEDWEAVGRFMNRGERLLEFIESARLLEQGNEQQY